MRLVLDGTNPSLWSAPTCRRFGPRRLDGASVAEDSRQI